MRINITGHHIEITNGLKSAVAMSFDKLIKHYPDVDRVDVVLTVEKNAQLAEAIVHFMGQDLVAKASSADLYTSISDLKSKMETLLQKRKATVKSRNNRKPANASVHAEEAFA
ncbi:MAG: ribosome-associated translation inhibitor RaiA [Pseudomonadales bacterium]|nr:ribosome-associated translation inhibitor RaiA [Pseudomonadales bacterium]